MIAVGASVGNDAHLKRRQDAVAPRANFHFDSYRMPCGRSDELFFAGELELVRPAGLERGERADVFGQNFLLAAEAAANPLAQREHTIRHETEKETELLLGNVRSLAAGADVKPILVEPRDRAMRLEMRVLDAMRRINA